MKILQLQRNYSAITAQLQRNYSAITAQFNQKILIIIPLLFFNLTIFSQVFLNDYPLFGLSPDQLSRKQVYENSPYFESSSIIEVGDLPNMVTDGILDLQIPGSSDIFSFKAFSIESLSNGDYVFGADLIQTVSLGEVLSEDEVEGDLLLIKKGDKKYGEIRIEDKKYSIRNLGNGKSLLMKLDTESFPNESFCGNGSSADNISAQNSSTPNINLENNNNDIELISSNKQGEGNGCLVKVLILYTEDALANNPDVEDFIDVQYQNLTHILPKSKIFSEHLRFKKVGVEQIDKDIWGETGNPTNDVASIHTTPEIITLREDFEADIVIVMTDDVYSTIQGQVTAIGEDATFADKAFAIVAVSELSSQNYVFAHEVGHLFGAHHEGTDLCPLFTTSTGTIFGGDDSGQAHAHAFYPKKRAIFHTSRKRTIMCGCNTRIFGAIKHYSNPNVKWKGGETGKNETNYNAKIMRDESCRVSEYITIPFSNTYITGPYQACNDIPLHVLANTSGNQGVPNYQWRSNYSGFNFNGPVESTSSSFMIIPFGNVGQTLYIQLIVDEGGPNEQILTHQILIVDEGCNEFGGKSFKLITTPNSNSKLQLYPNPTHNKVTLSIPQNEDDYFEVSFVDISGNTKKKFIVSNDSLEDISIGSLSSGVYTVTCKSKNHFFYSKLLILK